MIFGDDASCILSSHLVASTTCLFLLWVSKHSSTTIPLMFPSVSFINKRIIVGHNGHTERGGELVCQKFIKILPSFSQPEYINQIGNQMHQLNKPIFISTFITSKRHKNICNLICIYCTWKTTLFLITISTK